MNVRRKRFNLVWGIAAAVLAIFSLALGAWSLTWHDPVLRKQIGYTIIGGWTLLPPIFFWTEWTYYVEKHEEDSVKHSHDLSRNIWIALVVVLAALFGVSFKDLGN